MDLKLNDECKKDLLLYAREAIGQHLGQTSEAKFHEDWPVLNDNLGLFVTLTISGNLRGCIGYIETPTAVRDSLKELAFSAAFRDPRFPALTADEFAKIDVEITILSKAKKISDIGEIKIGRHGLIISQGYNRGLLLPQVATDHDMDVDEFLKHTCHKAGLSGQAWRDKETMIETFEGYIFSEKEFMD